MRPSFCNKAMMRKILCLLCALVLLSVAMAEGFVFDGIITWDSTLEQASDWLGEGVEKTRDDMGDYGVVEVLSKPDAACLGLDCAVTVMAYDGEIAMIAAYFPDADVQTVRDRLVESYGEPSEPNGSVFHWRPDDNTELSLYDGAAQKNSDGTPYPCLCGLTVTNRRVYDEMEHAATAYYETED